MSSGPSVSIKQPKARKPLHQFATTLDVKPNIVIRRLCDVKSKRKAIITGSQLWSKIPKEAGPYKKMNMLKVRFIVGFFVTLKFSSLQEPMIASKLPLMGKQHHS